MSLFINIVNGILFVVSLSLLFQCKSILKKVNEQFEKNEVTEKVLNSIVETKEENKMEIKKEEVKPIKQKTPLQMVEELIKELQDEGINCIEKRIPGLNDNNLISNTRKYLDKRIEFEEYIENTKDPINCCFSLENKEYILEKIIHYTEFYKNDSHFASKMKLKNNIQRNCYLIAKEILINRFSDVVNFEDLNLVKEICKKEIRINVSKIVVDNMGK